MVFSRDTSLCLLLFCLLVTPRADGAPTTEPAGVAQRLPVPKSLEQQRAEKLIRARFAADYADRDPSSRLIFYKKLLEAAAEPAIDAPTRFVLLREARERAIEGGNLNAAFHAIDELDHAFAIDARNMKVSAMSIAIDKTLVSPAELGATYLRLTSDFLADGDIDMAKKAAQLASDVAHSNGNAALRVRVAEADKSIVAARRTRNEVVEAVQKLKKDPHDEVSALRVGVYACVVRGQWTEGLPLLAVGADTTLKDLALQELTPPTTGAAMAKLADGWCDYAKTLTDAPAFKVRSHAAHWYELALPQLQGDAKTSAEGKLAELKH